MSEFRRRLMMAGKALPYDAEVNYIEKSGRAYIDTGIKASSTLKFSLNFYIPANSLYDALFGARVSTSSKRMDFVNARDNRNYSWWSFNNSTSQQSSLGEGYYNFSNRVASNNMFTGNRNYSRNSATFTSDNNFYLFAMNNNGTLSISDVQDRLYPSQIWDNGVLVRDYICVRKNGVGYLYDRVSEQLFGNANSEGSFTYGADVPFDAEVEYLKTDGNAYIDTSITASNIISIDCNVIFDSSADGWIFGSRIANQNAQFGLLNDPSTNKAMWRFGAGNADIALFSNGSYHLRNMVNTLYVNSLSNAPANNTFSNTYNISLFGLNNAGVWERPAIAKMQNTLLCSGLNLVRLFVPVRKNGVGCMYDYISGALSYNANSEGAFVLGNDK